MAGRPCGGARPAGCSQSRSDPAPTSRIVTRRGRPGVRPTETSSARSNSSRPREAKNRPTLQRQLETGRSLPTGQQPTYGPNVERPPGEPGGREPPLPGYRPVQWPTPRPGLRPREIQDEDGQLATRLPYDGQQPGQLGRVEAASD